MAENGSRRQRRNGRFHGRHEDSRARCAIPGCDEPGEFRAPAAPQGREQHEGPGEWRWLCLDHVRAFNAAYDYFDGMSDEEVQEAQHPVNGWAHVRRVYRWGESPPPKWSDFADPLDAIAARFSGGIEKPRADGKPLRPADRRALETLGLALDADARAVRRRYSELVRRYHPDRNGGDRAHEKALAEVISAYAHLRNAPAFA